MRTASVTIAHPNGFTEESVPPSMMLVDVDKSSSRPLRRHAIAALILIVTLGFSLRVHGLESAGFNEDEVQKVNAARAYLRGDFSRNLEHPMLMKSLIAVSLAAADRWNGVLGRSHHVSEEFAVRLPNVIFGAITAVVIFSVVKELFSVEIGLLSALLWSSGTIAIMDNRLAKEDTLLVFFSWLGYYFYIRAKKASLLHIQDHMISYGKWYAAAGASFGLMLASKYFPHYLGLIFLYYFLPPNRKTYPSFRQRDYLLLFGTCALVFLIANPIILAPGTIKYFLHYVAEGTMTHHGYLMMGNFYFNDPAHFHGRMPFYFYLLMLAIKTPIPVLLALCVGIVEIAGWRKGPGVTFVVLMSILWIVPFSLLSAKWLRWLLSWMPTIYVFSAIGLSRLFSLVRSLAEEGRSRLLTPALDIVTFLIFLVLPILTAAKAGPYYSLYLNPLGRGRTGYYFPHEEFADAGLRPAIFKICKEAPARSVVGGEAPPVFAYYLHQCGRRDLRYFSLSDADREALPSSAYLVVEEGRKYFDNISFIRAITSKETPAWTAEIAGVSAAIVYRTSELTELRNGHESNVTLR